MEAEDVVNEEMGLSGKDRVNNLLARRLWTRANLTVVMSRKMAKSSERR